MENISSSIGQCLKKSISKKKNRTCNVINLAETSILHNDEITKSRKMTDNKRQKNQVLLHKEVEKTKMETPAARLRNELLHVQASSHVGGPELSFVPPHSTNHKLF